MELSSTLLALRSLICLNRARLPCLCLLSMPFGGCFMFGRAFTLALGLLLLLRRRDRMCLDLLPMSSYLTAEPLALTLALAAFLGRPADRDDYECEDHHCDDDDGDHGDR